MNFTLKQKAIKRLEEESKERKDNEKFEEIKKELGIENTR